jgi:hypothetical protein
VTLAWCGLDCHWEGSKKKSSKKSKGGSSKEQEQAGSDGADGSSSGGSKQILHGLTGSARPGRCVWRAPA